MTPNDRAWRHPRKAATFWAASLALAAAALPASSPTALATAAPAPASISTAPALTTPAAEPVSGLRLEVNVPAFRLDAYLGDQRIASFPVTAGKRQEPTVTGRFEIRAAIWNPWWHPPANRRPKDKVTPPGPRNPMGRVKLPFAGLYYIHGTALDKDIGRPASRGCVRLRNEDILALAELVHRHAGPLLPAEELAAIAANPRRTRRLELTVPVPVSIVYRLVEVRDGTLSAYDDVYRTEPRPLAELALAELAATGVPIDRLDQQALAAALVQAPLGGLLVESLLRAAGEELAVEPTEVAVTVTAGGPGGG